MLSVCVRRLGFLVLFMLMFVCQCVSQCLLSKVVWFSRVLNGARVS